MKAACVGFFKTFGQKKKVLFSVVLTVEVSVKNTIIKEEGVFYESGYRSIN